MKLDYLKVVKPIPLKEYDRRYSDQAVHVWLNPPRVLKEKREKSVSALHKRMAEMAQAENDNKLTAEMQQDFDQFVSEFSQQTYEWFAEIWSQGPEDTHWTADELAEMDETDPALMSWLVARSIDMQNEHRDFTKKA